MNKNVVVRAAGAVCAAVLMLGGAASAASAAPQPDENANVAATADAAVNALIRLDVAGLVQSLLPDIHAHARVNADADVDAKTDVDATVSSKVRVN